MDCSLPRFSVKLQPIIVDRVEWHTEALVDEIQVVRVLAPVQKHVQVVTSSATDQNEVQVIRLVGTGAGADVTEIQSVLYTNSE